MTASPHRLAAFFAPRNFAMIGASDKSFWSQEIFRDFAACGFAGNRAIGKSLPYLVNKIMGGRNVAAATK